MPATRLPAFQFYPGDLMKDPGYKRCTQAERGVLLGFLCTAHECEFRGALFDNGMAWCRDELAIALGGDKTENLVFIDGLIAKGPLKVWSKVSSKEDLGTTRPDLCPDFPDGTLYSRRMLRDEIKRQACSEAGKKGGGNPDLQTFKGTAKGDAKGANKGRSKAKGGSSSSSSFSTSVEENTPPTPQGASVGEVDTSQRGQKFLETDLEVAAVYQAYPRMRGKDAANRMVNVPVNARQLIADFMTTNPDYPLLEAVQVLAERQQFPPDLVEFLAKPLDLLSVQQAAKERRGRQEKQETTGEREARKSREAEEQSRREWEALSPDEQARREELLRRDFPGLAKGVA